MDMKTCIGSPVEGKGYGMGVASGKTVYPLALRPEDINLYDIAAHLGRMCRYNGGLLDHVEIYSVAQHSVHVSHLVGPVPKPVIIQALMHDAAEAYVGDMVRPLKPCIPQFEEIENLVWNVICERFDIYPTLPDIVKWADDAALATEFRDVAPTPREEVRQLLPTPDIKVIKPLLPRAARDLFLQRAKELGIC